MKKSTLLHWQDAQVIVSYEPHTGIVIGTTQDLTDLLTIVFPSTMTQPAYAAVLLTKANQVIGWADITSQNKSGPIIDTKKLIGSVYATACHRVVVVHHGPVSAATPLDGEYMLCFKLQMVLASYGAYLKDLIIRSDSDYFSFEEAGIVLPE